MVSTRSDLSNLFASIEFARFAAVGSSDTLAVNYSNRGTGVMSCSLAVSAACSYKRFGRQ